MLPSSRCCTTSFPAVDAWKWKKGAVRVDRCSPQMSWFAPGAVALIQNSTEKIPNDHTAPESQVTCSDCADRNSAAVLALLASAPVTPRFGVLT